MGNFTKTILKYLKVQKSPHLFQNPTITIFPCILSHPTRPRLVSPLYNTRGDSGMNRIHKLWITTRYQRTQLRFLSGNSRLRVFFAPARFAVADDGCIRTEVNHHLRFVDIHNIFVNNLALYFISKLYLDLYHYMSYSFIKWPSILVNSVIWTMSDEVH